MSEHVLPGSRELWGVEGVGAGGGTSNVYTHVSKCKNNKIEGEKKHNEISFIPTRIAMIRKRGSKC
jgi:hypothetical protein